jgi:hypothetical protein
MIFVLLDGWRSPHWLSEYPISVPSSVSASAEKFGIDAELLGPFDHVQRLAAPLNYWIALLVRALCRLRGPSAVVRRVRSIIVDAIESVTVRACTHIGDERLKTVAPAITHRNTSPPVAVVVRTRSGVATSLRVDPRGIGGRGSSVYRLPVSRVRCAYTLSPPASATPRYAALEIRGTDLSDVPAVASAEPLRSASVCREIVCSIDDRPSSKPLTGQINKRRHDLEF